MNMLPPPFQHLAINRFLHANFGTFYHTVYLFHSQEMLFGVRLFADLQL